MRHDGPNTISVLATWADGDRGRYGAFCPCGWESDVIRIGALFPDLLSVQTELARMADQHNRSRHAGGFRYDNPYAPTPE